MLISSIWNSRYVIGGMFWAKLHGATVHRESGCRRGGYQGTVCKWGYLRLCYPKRPEYSPLAERVVLSTSPELSPIACRLLTDRVWARHMATPLQALMTSRYVVGFPEQRLSYLAERIAEETADYCVILEPGTQCYLGLLRIADVASAVGADTRFLLDLLERDTHVEVPPDATYATIDRLLKKRQGAVPVVGDEGEFIGLITEQSYSAWLLKSERRKLRVLEKQLESRSATFGTERIGNETGTGVLHFPSSEVNADPAGDRSG